MTLLDLSKPPIDLFRRAEAIYSRNGGIEGLRLSSGAAPAPPIPEVRDESAPRAGRQRHARPKVAVDIVLFAVEELRLKCFLIQLKRGALKSRWAFPGGLVRVGEMLDAAARRQLLSPTGVRDAYMEQLFTFGDPSRDPHAHVVSVAYMALIADPQVVSAQTPKYSAGGWFEVSRLPRLAYDHSEMAEYALKRLKAKLEYTNIAYSLLPEKFTFKQLEELYAIILGRRLDRRNFRRRIMAMALVRKLPARLCGAHRPAALYSFASRNPQVVEML